LSSLTLYLRLAFGTALVLAPGWALSRALGIRSVAATLAWSLTLVFAALAVTFALTASLTLTVVLLGVAAIAAVGAKVARRGRERVYMPGRAVAAPVGLLLGIGLWHVAGVVQGDGLFHLARVRKLLEFGSLSLHDVPEFKDGGLHPGYAFPLWHGFVALVAKLSGADPEQVVLHLPSILAPIAVLVAYEVGWALFRRTWAAGAATGAQVALTCFAPGHGGGYVFLSLPATAARHLLVPAALALALEAIRAPTLPHFASAAAAGFVLAVVHPTYALFLWIPFVGFLLVRVLWTRSDVRAGSATLASLVVPAALFMLWLVPVVESTASVSPGESEVARAIAHYPRQLHVSSDTSYSLAAVVFTREGAVAVAALLLLPLAGLAARRRWAAYVAGGALAVLAVLLLPFLFTRLSDLVSISQSRRAAGFLPFAFAFAGGLGVLSRLTGPFVLPLALIGGTVLQLSYPGSFAYVLKPGLPAWPVWIAVVGGLAALLVGLFRRRPPLEETAGVAAALFLAPVVAVGLAKWTPPTAPPASRLSPGLVHALRTVVPKEAVVYSDPGTSYKIAAFAPVYIAVAPPGHVADTKANKPYVRARDLRKFLATGNLAIPRRYGAQYLVLDRLLTRRTFDLPELYHDPRYILYSLPSR
jgi:hypothetical protein